MCFKTILRVHSFETILVIPIPDGRVGFRAKNFPNECLLRVNRIFSSFFSFCYREQNERNDVPFIPKTE